MRDVRSGPSIVCVCHLQIESPSKCNFHELKPGESFGELLEAVGHLSELRALSARSFICSTFQGILEAIPQLRELWLRDCVMRELSSRDLRALDALMTRLEV